MNLDVSIVSVITSGCVAVATIFIPLLFNFLSDRSKWLRERKMLDIQKIEKATQNLLAELSTLWAGNFQRMNFAETHQKLLTSFYDWTQSIEPYCGKLEIERIGNIRDEIETKLLVTDIKVHRENQPRLSKEIQSLAQSAMNKVR